MDWEAQDLVVRAQGATIPNFGLVMVDVTRLHFGRSTKISHRRVRVLKVMDSRDAEFRLKVVVVNHTNPASQFDLGFRPFFSSINPCTM